MSEPNADYRDALPKPTPANMWPHCGRVDVELTSTGLTSFHYEPTLPKECHGSSQIPRCVESGARPLGNGKPNRSFRG